MIHLQSLFALLIFPTLIDGGRKEKMFGIGSSSPRFSYIMLLDNDLFRVLEKYVSHSVKICLTENLTPHII